MMNMGPMGSPPMGMPPVQPSGLPPMGMDIPQMPPEVPVDEWPDDLRGEVVDWQGGKPLKLDKVMKSGKSLRDELSQHVKEVLESELKNQEETSRETQEVAQTVQGREAGG